MTDSVTEQTEPKQQTVPKRRRWIWPLIVLGLLVALGGAAALLYQPLLRRYVVAEAHKRGVELTLGQVALVGLFAGVELSDCDATLLGTEGRIRGKLDRVEIDLADLEPTRLRIDGLEAAVLGSAAIVAVDLSDWAKSYPEAFRVPVTAKDIKLSWRARSGGPEWLRIERGKLTPTSDGGRFSTPAAEVVGVPVGRVDASWTADSSVVTLGFGRVDPAEALVRMDVKHAAEQPTAVIKLRQTTLRDLGAPLGVALPAADATVEGEATLRLSKRDVAGLITGQIRMTLAGYTPPRPQQLAGLSFSDKTELTTAFELSEDRAHVRLTDTQVTHGSFRLQGDGEIERLKDYTKLQLRLKGAISCADLAAVAARSAAAGLPAGLRALLALGARQLITGSVSFALDLAADTRDLTQAKLTKTIGVGCGLRPIELPDLPDVTPLLPPLPSGLPSVLPLPLPLP